MKLKLMIDSQRFFNIFMIEELQRLLEKSGHTCKGVNEIGLPLEINQKKKSVYTTF